MSKSLKNFTTIREALERGTWTSRGLRIVFLLGNWRDGIEITDDFVQTGKAWEEKLDNFFLNSKQLTLRKDPPSNSDTDLSAALKDAQAAAREALLDSFNTPAVMSIISDLISRYNNIFKATLMQRDVNDTALWVTSMVNMFGLNGTAPPDSTDIGWEGIDNPEHAKPYVYPLSSMRDSLRNAARSSEGIDSQNLARMLDPDRFPKPPSEDDPTKPFADLSSDFQVEAAPLISDFDKNSKAILSLCDRLRDSDLFELGVYLEDRDNQPALVRPVSEELRQARTEIAEKVRRKEAEKESARQEALQRAGRGTLREKEMFRTNEFSEWDHDGIPTKDADGEPLAKSRVKKLRKD